MNTPPVSPICRLQCVYLGAYAIEPREQLVSHVEGELTHAHAGKICFDELIKLGKLRQDFNRVLDVFHIDEPRINASGQKSNDRFGVHYVIRGSERFAARSIMRHGSELRQITGFANYVVQSRFSISMLLIASAIVSIALLSGDSECDYQRGDASNRLNPGSRHRKNFLCIPHGRAISCSDQSVRNASGRQAFVPDLTTAE